MPAQGDLEEEALRSLDMAGVFPAAQRALTPTEYDCIERYYKHEQSYGAIAQQSGKTYSAVRSINERALRKLRRSREMLAQREAYIGATYRLGGLGRFKDTRAELRRVGCDEAGKYRKGGVKMIPEEIFDRLEWHEIESEELEDQLEGFLIVGAEPVF